MSVEKNVPEIRFEGFSGYWSETVLAHACSNFRSGKFIKAEDIKKYGAYPVYGGNGLRGYTSEYNHEGSYALIGRQGALCGNMNFSHGKAFFTEHAIAVQANEKNDTIFLYYKLGLMNLGQYSGQSAQPGLSVNKLTELETYTPVKQEQTKIGNYFQKLDNLINQHQQKHDKLSSIKKAMLEKMFPKQGETIPEIRFKGFSGEWRATDLASACSNFQSGKFIKAEDIKENEEYPVYGGNGLRGFCSTYNHEGIYALIGRQGALCGNMNLSHGKAFFTEHAIAVQANKNCDTLFIFYKLGTMNLGQYSGQSAQPGLSVTNLIKLIIFVPEYREQNAIGNCFQKLDTLINQHQQQITKLNNIKQACLSKMFV